MATTGSKCTKCGLNEKAPTSNSYCKPCINADGRERQAKARKLFNRYKTIKGCVDCGYRANADGLEFDHIDPKTKKFSIGNSYSRGRKALLEELAKCEVRCGTCHNIKTCAARRKYNDDMHPKTKKDPN